MFCFFVFTFTTLKNSFKISGNCMLLNSTVIFFFLRPHFIWFVIIWQSSSFPPFGHTPPCPVCVYMCVLLFKFFKNFFSENNFYLNFRIIPYLLYFPGAFLGTLSAFFAYSISSPLPLYTGVSQESVIVTIYICGFNIIFTLMTPKFVYLAQTSILASELCLQLQLDNISNLTSSLG